MVFYLRTQPAFRRKEPFDGAQDREAKAAEEESPLVRHRKYAGIVRRF